MESDAALQGEIKLPHDLIFDILSWMPTKSVCRFKCCSKFINELTNDAYFAMKHSQNLSLKDGDSCFFVQRKVFGGKTETEIHALPGDKESSSAAAPSKFLDFLDKNCATIMASSNGLLLCMTTRDDDSVQLFICNPITQSCSFIPMPPSDLEVQKHAFNIVEFAFECDVEDYTLLALQYQYTLSSISVGCKIYLPKEGVWKFRQGFSGWEPITRSYLSSILHKGVLHFSYFDTDLVSYNLESDLTRRLNLPEEALITSGGLRFFEMDIFKWGKTGSSNESICLVKLVNDIVFTVWVLTDYESSYSWSKFLTISLQEMGLTTGEEDPEVLVTKFKVINGISLLFATSSNVYSYDLIGERETRVEKVCDRGYMWNSVFTSYSQTLRSCGPGAISLY